MGLRRLPARHVRAVQAVRRPDSADEPSPEDCTRSRPRCCDSDELRQQLEALQKCISLEKASKRRSPPRSRPAKRATEALDKLIDGFDGIVEEYRTKRHKLTCREDALKGLLSRHGEGVSGPPPISGKLPAGDCRRRSTSELCELEKAKCCQKNLEGKLGTDTAGKVTKFTKIIWEQQQATRALAERRQGVHESQRPSRRGLTISSSHSRRSRIRLRRC